MLYVLTIGDKLDQLLQLDCEDGFLLSSDCMPLACQCLQDKGAWSSILYPYMPWPFVFSCSAQTSYAACERGLLFEKRIRHLLAAVLI
eukprot:c25169_g1_i2 orf=188-451(+)